MVFLIKYLFQNWYVIFRALLLIMTMSYVCVVSGSKSNNFIPSL